MLTPGQRPALFLQTMLVRQASAGQLRDVGDVIGLPLTPKSRTCAVQLGISAMANSGHRRQLFDDLVGGHK
jgi:hypothetical protein